MRNAKFIKIGNIQKKSIITYFLIIFGSCILSFGLFNIHYQSGISEGGELGLELLLQHHFGISPAITAFVFDLIFLAIGVLVLKGQFALKALIGVLSYSISYAIFENLGPVFPSMANVPILAAIVGALFVGIGAGIVVASGGVTGGDDALAVVLSKITKLNISYCYFIFDFIVIILSLTYLPITTLKYSLLTSIISSIIIGLVQKFSTKSKKNISNKSEKVKK